MQRAVNFARARINFECHFVGDGPDQKSLTELVKQAGLSDKVRFHGRLTRDEIARLLLDADVLTAPSVPTSDGRREGIPVVLMEAMGSGVPVIASNLSGIPELVNDQLTGLLVPPRDATSLADALECYSRIQTYAGISGALAGKSSGGVRS